MGLRFGKDCEESSSGTSAGSATEEDSVAEEGLQLEIGEEAGVAHSI